MANYVLVRVVTRNWANEIQWNIDGGITYPSDVYPDNLDIVVKVDVPEGVHTFYYIDSYGDGWHDGFWELMDSNGMTIAGGCPAGQVQGSGGAATFCIGGDAAGCASVDLGSEQITVHISTLEWANEITWSMDDGELFGVTPPYSDNVDQFELMTVPSGFHTLSYFDSYGDGWHGGWWEILPGSVDANSAAGVDPIAGGPTEGLVCLLYTSPSPRDATLSRMPSSA